MIKPLSSTVDKICEDGCFCERCVPGGVDDEVWDLMIRLAECGAAPTPVSSS